MKETYSVPPPPVATAPDTVKHETNVAFHRGRHIRFVTVSSDPKDRDKVLELMVRLLKKP